MSAVGSEPFDNLSIVIKRRRRTEKKPTIYAIDTGQACFNFTWLAESQNRSPVVHRSAQVVRMKGNRPAPIARRLRDKIHRRAETPKSLTDPNC